jgi:hypothetical protein
MEIEFIRNLCFFFEEQLVPFYEGYLGIFHLHTVIDTGNALMFDVKKFFAASGH